MGWTVWYQLVRAEAPSAEELAALAAAAAVANATPWDAEPFRLRVRQPPASDGVHVDGASTIAMSLDESEDGPRMVAAINAALDALPGSSLRLHDDFGAFGVVDGRCSLEGDAADSPSDVDPGELVAIEDLVQTATPLPAELDRALAARALDGAATVIEQALAALGTLDRADPRRSAVLGLLETVPLLQRAQIGLDRYQSLGRPHETREYVGTVVSQLDDVTPLVPAFIAAWQRPTGIYHYGDMPWRQATRDRFARAPEVIGQMASDLAAAEREDGDSELPLRRAEHAAAYLARSGAPAAIATLIDLVRRWRGQDAHWRLRSYLLDGCRRALGDFPHPRAAATMALELAGCRPFGQPRDALLQGLARVDPHRALPVLRQACAGRAGMRAVIEALAAAGTGEALALLDALRRYPLRGARDAIAWLDREAGRPTAEVAPMPAPELLLDHPDRDVRQDALEALIQRGDPALYTALVHAEALHRALQRHDEGSSCGPSWYGWEERGVVPEPILRASSEEKLAWAAGEGAERLGPQVQLDAMEPVRRLGAAAVAATYPEQRIVFTAGETDALLAEEATNLSALRAGS
jgi:hypothetical protein